MPFKAGGVNSALPLRIAAERGLPIEDADGRGRPILAFQKETLQVNGESAWQVIIATEQGNSVIIDVHPSAIAEQTVRGATVPTGGQRSLTIIATDGRAAKRVSILGTMSLIRSTAAPCVLPMNGTRIPSPPRSRFRRRLNTKCQDIVWRRDRRCAARDPPGLRARIHADRWIRDPNQAYDDHVPEP